jgi:hypothetical protein
MHKSSNTPSQKFLMDEQFTAVFPSLIRLLSGDVLSAVVLQAIHFRAQLSELPDGWVKFTMQDLSDQIGISKYQAQRAINKLRETQLNLLFEDNQKGYNNSKIWKVDQDRLLELEHEADSLDSQVKRIRSTNKAESLHKPSDIAISTITKEIYKEDIRTTRTYGDENHQACNLLADLIEANGSRRPTVSDKWQSDMDKLNRIDERSWEQITKAIEWCQADDFWRGNIMSPAKLRKQYDQLRLAAQRGNKQSKFTKTMDWIRNLENETKELEQ